MNVMPFPVARRLWFGVAVLIASIGNVGGQGFELPDFAGGSDLSGGFALPSDLMDVQTADPVTWTAAAEPPAADDPVGTDVRLAITAKVADGYHVYSVRQKPGGPSPTRLTITGGRALAEPTPDRQPHRTTLKTYPGIPIDQFEDSVTWTIPVDVSGDESSLVVDTFALACSDDAGRCVPQPAKLTVPLVSRGSEVREAAGPATAAGPEFRDDDYAVAWTATVSPAVVAPGQTAVLSFRAKPDAGFHVYEGVTNDDRSKTNFAVTDKAGLRVGGPTTDRPVIEESIVPSLPPIRYHDGPVTWQLPVAVPGDAAEGEQTVEGFIAYQACTDSSCLPPRGLRFAAPLTIGDAATMRTASVDLVSVKATRALDAASTSAWVDDVELPAEAAADTPPEDAVGSITPGGTGGPDAPEGPGGGNSGASDGDGGVNVAVASTATPLWWLLVLAFGGGLILNVMPCVLPVLGIKLVGLAEQSGNDRGKILRVNAGTIAGIFAVFMGLAVFTAVFNQAWGTQFQNFGVRVTAIVALFAFALSYLGVWHIPSPNLGGGAGGDDDGLIASFGKGVFATLLATPCSGPLLGGVFAALLGASLPTVFLVFAAMAAGMSLPYAVVGLFPAAASWLPKPGNWMETFKEAMAFVMLLAVAYVFYQFKEEHKVPVFIMLVGVWFGCWLFGKVPEYRPLRHRLFALAAGVVAAVIVSVTGFRLMNQDGYVDWVDYTEPTLERYQADGRTVLVDFSAKWCPTCLLNLSRAIDRPRVADTLEELDAVALYADWSEYDPAVGAKIKELQSASIPLLAIYPGDDPENPIVLRDIVTTNQVLDALKEAGPSVDRSAVVAPPTVAVR